MSITFEEVMECHPDNPLAFKALVEHMEKAVPLLPFVGAGLSKPIYQLWGEVLGSMGECVGKTVAEEVQRMLKQNQHMDAASLLAKKRGTVRWRRDIRESFATELIQSEEISKAARLLPELWRGGVITTNYDHVLDVVYREAGNPFVDAVIPRGVYDQGELKEAGAKYAEAKKLYQKERDDLGLANVLQRQGDLAVFNRNYMEAKKLYENALQSYILSKAIIGEVRTRGKLCIVYAKTSENLKNKMIENTKSILANFKYENIKKEVESYLHESERQA